MECAQILAVDAQGTSGDAMGGIGDAYDFEKGERVGVAVEEEAAIDAALRGYDAGAME